VSGAIERAALVTLRQRCDDGWLAQQGLQVAPAGAEALRVTLLQQHRQKALKVQPEHRAC
jgi:hypothetical protein